MQPLLFVDMPAPPPVLSIFLVFIRRLFSARSCRCIIALLLPRSVAGHVYKSGPFAPVVLQIDHHVCKLWVSAPVVVHWCCPELRQESALLRVLRNSPRAMPLFGSPGTPHENKVSYSTPVPADDLRFTCADPALFAPVVVQIVHHVCKTGLFAHVIILF